MNVVNVEQLAQDLRMYRAKHRLTMQQLADKLGMCRQTLSKIEKCKECARQKLDTITLMMIKNLGIEIKYL